MRFKMLAALAIVATGAAALTGCSGGGDQSKTVTVMYESTDAFPVLNNLFTKVKPEFEKAHKGITVKLQPVKANDDDYKTKLQLAQRSPNTAPDVFYEDSYNVQADASAGYLLKLDPYLGKWSDWSQFTDAAKAAGAGTDGTYAVPLGVDTRVIWYNKSILEKAGVTVPWQPHSWQDILDTAAKVKATSPGVIPFNMYIGTGMGEGAATSTNLPLLLGAGDKYYNAKSGKWVLDEKAETDVLSFLNELYGKGYATTPQQALDPNIWQVLDGTDLKEGKLAGIVEGSYLPSFWQQGGSYPWPDYAKTLGVALFPTQTGSSPGYVSVSGGWTLAVGAKSKSPQLAFDFLAMALNKENALAYDKANSQLAARKDVAADPSYLASNPFMKDVSAAVQYTHFRPSTADYAKVSIAFQKATEQVVVKGESPAKATKDYEDAVIQIVGKDKTTKQ